MRISADDFTEVPYPPMHAIHLEEVALINSIYARIEAMEHGTTEPMLLTQRLDELFKHTTEHFAGEEQLMADCHFPAYAMHKGAHDLFLREFGQVVAAWKSNQQVGPVGQFMRQHLPAWLKQHIGTLDFVTAGFVAARL